MTHVPSCRDPLFGFAQLRSSLVGREFTDKAKIVAASSGWLG
jgi:hypothetical protein